MKHLSYLILLLCAFNTAAQTTFQRTYTANTGAWGLSGTPTMDGGFVVLGRIDTGSSKQALYVVKADSTGMPVWKKQIYTPSSLDMQYFSARVKETSSGDLLVAATLELANGGSSNVNEYILYMKLDPSGNVIWDRMVDTAANFLNAYVEDIAPTSDGGFVLGGRPLVKFDAQGNVTWSKREYSNTHFSILPISGGYVSLSSNGPSIDKRDAAGNIVARKLLNNGGAQRWPKELQVLPDGGYIILANYIQASPVQPYDGSYICRLDSAFSVLWSKTVDGPGVDVLNGIAQASDGGFVFAGATSSVVGNMDGYLLKLDASGNLIWARSYGTSQNQYFTEVKTISNGGYLAVGGTDTTQAFFRSIYMVKTDIQGNTNCLQTNWTPQVIDTPTTVSDGLIGSVFTVLNFSPAIKTPIVSSKGTSFPYCPSCVSSIPAAVIVTGPTSFCAGGSAQLSASAGNTWLWSTGATTQNINATASGVYTVAISDVNGCVSAPSPTVNIIVWQPVIPTVTRIVDTLRSSPAVTYQWYFNGGIVPGNGNAITGATSQDYVAGQNGKYVVQTTDTNGCVGYSQSFVFTLGIDDLDLRNSIYPNPADNRLFIKMQMPCSITISDITGKVAYSTSINKDATVDVSQWTKGLYIAVFTDNDGRRYAYRFMVE